MQINRIHGMLGFAMRAGKLVIGTEQVFIALSKGKNVKLVVFSDGASEATAKKITSKCEFYKTKKVRIPTTPEELGRLLGKDTTPVCIGVCDVSFAKEIALAADEVWDDPCSTSSSGN